MLERGKPVGDFHRHTVYHDHAFHFFMDRLYGPLWRTWPFRRVRGIAKAFNFGKLYGGGVSRLEHAVAVFFTGPPHDIYRCPCATCSDRREEAANDARADRTI